MGRPLNKRYFGPPTDAGNEIRVTFWNGFASVQGWIIKQTGSKKFLCTDGTNEFECMLSNKDGAVAASHPSAQEDAAIGEMTITILTDAQKAVQVEKISAHKVRADDGEMYPWTFEASNYDGAAQTEEAGGAEIGLIDALPLREYEIVSLGNTEWKFYDLSGDNSPYSVGDTFVMKSAIVVGTGTVRLAGTVLVGNGVQELPGNEL